MYLGLVTFYIHYTSSFYIYDDDVRFHLYLTCVVAFLSLCTCFFFYIICLHFTLDALTDLVLSVSAKIGCKSFMP